jgi:micrococcal nuclease
MRLIYSLAVAVFGLAVATQAHADSCEAPVNHYRAGEHIIGRVMYVGDGDSICVGNDRDPNHWIEIRLADFYAPELHEAGGLEARRRMVQTAKSKPVVCTVQRGNNGRTYSYDRVIAVCRMNGTSLSQLMESEGVREGGRGWRFQIRP